MGKAKARKKLKKLLATGTGSKSKIKRLEKIINKKSKPRYWRKKLESDDWRKKLNIVSGSFEQGKKR